MTNGQARAPVLHRKKIERPRFRAAHVQLELAAGLRERNRHVVRPRCRRDMLDLDDLKLGHHLVDHWKSRFRFAILGAAALFRPLFSVENPHGEFPFHCPPRESALRDVRIVQASCQHAPTLAAACYLLRTHDLDTRCDVNENSRHGAIVLRRAHRVRQNGRFARGANGRATCDTPDLDARCRLSLPAPSPRTSLSIHAA